MIVPSKRWPPRWYYILGTAILAGGFLWGIVSHFLPKPRPETSFLPAGNDIRQGPGSIVQIGGSNNQATILARPHPRSLTPEQSRGIALAIASLPKSTRFFVKTIDGNREAYTYADQFQQIIRAGGREGDANIQIGAGWAPPPVGLMLVVHSLGDAVVPHADVLLQQLRNLGVSVEPKHGDWVPEGALYVVIGAQP